MSNSKFVSISATDIACVHGGQGLPPGAFRGFRAPNGSGGPNALPPASLKGLLDVPNWDRYARPPRGGYETKMGDIYDKNDNLIRRNPK